MAIAIRATEIPPAASLIEEPGLCHGAMGLAHLYNRIYQAGGGELFAKSARQWYRLGLEMRKGEQGVAGFIALEPGQDNRMEWAAVPGFLTGAAGIGLSLLAAVTDVEPDWDRVLLASIPCSSR